MSILNSVDLLKNFTFWKQSVVSLSMQANTWPSVWGSAWDLFIFSSIFDDNEDTVPNGSDLTCCRNIIFQSAGAVPLSRACRCCKDIPQYRTQQLMNTSDVWLNFIIIVINLFRITVFFSIILLRLHPGLSATQVKAFWGLVVAFMMEFVLQPVSPGYHLECCY